VKGSVGIWVARAHGTGPVWSHAAWGTRCPVARVLSWLARPYASGLRNSDRYRGSLSVSHQYAVSRPHHCHPDLTCRLSVLVNRPSPHVRTVREAVRSRAEPCQTLPAIGRTARVPRQRPWSDSPPLQYGLSLSLSKCP
jgi:hypothetical protein